MKKITSKRVVRWTPKNIVTEASLFRTAFLWEKISPKSVKAAKRLSLYELCLTIINTRHYDILKRGVSIEHGEEVDELIRRAKIGHRKAGSSQSEGKGLRKSWTVEEIIRSCIPYETFSAWKSSESKAYRAAASKGLIHVISRLLGGNVKVAEAATNYFELSNEALLTRLEETKAQTWKELRRKNLKLFKELQTRTLTNGMVTHLGIPRGKKGSRTIKEENIRNYCQEVSSLRMLERRLPGAINASKRLGIFDEIKSTYFTQTTVGKKLSISDCIESSASHERFVDWVRSDRQAAIRATRQGWLKECSYHFTDI
jgi:hypothetical protein